MSTNNKDYLKYILHNVINNMPYAVWLKNIDGAYLLVNKEYERFYGIKMKDMVVNDVMYNLVQNDLVLDGTLNNLEDVDNTVISEKRTITQNVVMQINNERRTISITKSPMIGLNGQVIGVLGLSHDITDEVNAEKEKAEKELTLAKEILLSTLPQVFPPFPNRSDFDLHAMLKAAKQVGGDFYDFYFVSNNTLAFTVADVSDKGMPAAVFMMKAKSMLKNAILSSPVLEKVLEKVNDAICSNNDKWFFVTAGVGLVNLDTGEVTYLNAGHTHPLLKTKDGDVKCLEPPVNVALGLFGDVKFEPMKFTMQAGETLLLLTDGIIDAKSPQGESYGNVRIGNVLKDTKGSSRDIVNAIKTDISAFVKDAPQVDDLTMLAFTYLGKDNYTNKTVVPDYISELTDFNTWLETCCFECGISEDLKAKILMATEEIFVNLAYYEYPDIKKDNIPETTVYFRYIKTTNELTLTFIDAGAEDNPLIETTNPLREQTVEEKSVGGFSVAMVSNLADKLDYEYINNQNVLSITFKA